MLVPSGRWLVFATVASVAQMLAPEIVRAQGRQSVIVQNRDGGGTTIVKVFNDTGQEWTILNLWATNQANGVVREPDGSTVNLSCTPANRTNQVFDLNCFVFDATADEWVPLGGQTTVGADFLNGPFLDTYNSLFALPGEYVTTIEFPGFGKSYRIRLLDAAESPGGIWFFPGVTAPSTPTFLFRNTDQPSGTPLLTNFTLGMQSEGYCIDLHVTPSTPGGPLVGTFDVRELESGNCTDSVVQNRSATLLPSGGEGVAGTYCAYIVAEVGECDKTTPLQVGDRVCLPCAGECREFPDDIDVVLASGFAYVRCDDVVVEPASGNQCSRSCDGVQALGVVTAAQSSALTLR